MPDIEQLAGKMLGDYRVERLLGQSQLGAAYLAVEPVRGVKAMLTTFPFPEGQTTQEREQLRARFAVEGAALVRLVHAHILPVYAFGEQSDFLYLVTAFVKEASLGQMLKQNTRLEPQQTLFILRQLAAALDYAHGQGLVHGMLSLANVVVNERLETSIAGFGLRAMLEVHGHGQSSRPLAHLSSPQGAFLGSPEYIAPERVLGMACDARADIYALGAMIFALLSGVPPFRAATPLDIALQRLQQPAPLVHVACPTVPEAFDLVIGRALERDPARRFQSAGELLTAFERVYKAQEAAPQTSSLVTVQLSPGTQVTMPPTVDWFDEQFTSSGRWQVAPSIGTEQMRALNSAPAAFSGTLNPNDTAIMRDSQPVPAVFPFARSLASSPHSTDIMRASNHLPSVMGGRAQPLDEPETQRLRDNSTGPRPASSPPAPMPMPERETRVSGASLAGIDPFAWWSSHAGGRKQQLPAAPVPARRVALPLTGKKTGAQPDQQGRRKFVTLAVASVAAAGVVSIGGITFARLSQSLKQTPQSAGAPTAAPGTVQAQGGNATPGQPTAAATHAPAHTGTVIGATTQSVNSARVFNNPADGVSSLLIRLSSGKFVACERTCTHRGVLVDYDPARKMIVCPAHGAIFDPRNGFSHISGPGSGPLSRVTIHVNGDGTVTSG